MNDILKEKLSKIYALIERAGSDGERAAAQSALDRIVSKYNITPEMLRRVGLSEYVFTYKSKLEFWLLGQIIKVQFNQSNGVTFYRENSRSVSITLEYIDWVTISCMYEYFRRHMIAQWDIVRKELTKHRKQSIINKRRFQLQLKFFGKYIRLSNLYLDGDLVSVTNKTRQEMRDSVLMQDIEGGEYNKQVISNKLLD